MFQDASLVFTILAFLVIGAILYYFPRVDSGDWPLRLAMGLQMGGAMGNLIDRLTRDGHVTDFISVGNFPVFNIADSSISLGVAVLLVSVWLKERSEKREAARAAELARLATDE
jgi:signal peptidase II